MSSFTALLRKNHIPELMFLALCSTFQAEGTTRNLHKNLSNMEQGVAFQYISQQNVDLFASFLDIVYFQAMLIIFGKIHNFIFI